MKIQSKIARLATLPLLALRGLVVFPDMVLHFDVGRKKSMLALNESMTKDQLIFLVAQRDVRDDDPDSEQLYNVGVVARVRQVLKLPGDTIRVLIEGMYRAKIQSVVQADPFPVVNVRECLSRISSDEYHNQALIRECRTLFEDYASLAPKMSPDVPVNVSSIDDVGKLADYIASNIVLAADEKQTILATLHPVRRIERVMIILGRENNILSLEQGIHQRVQEQIDTNQREYYLREQMKAISEELGEADNPQEEADIYRARIAALNLSAEVEQALLSECDKLFRMPSGSHEATVVRSYLDTCLSLPWNSFTKDNLDLGSAQKVLDRDHYGLKDVKERILQILAVRQLAPDVKGQVVCLAGPPGVGKTSVAKSIAAAMGRKYVRVSLGGMRDEADIRGHRKTYIGAMPGRIISAVKQAGSMNPLILLDEIDKMGNDFRGDPASAMLEVLDTEQNNAFRDHYLEIPFDLSNVLFITTANDVGNIPRPLYDRMELINLPSYTLEEKFHIAKEHLLKKQVKRHGMTLRQLHLSDDMLRSLIDGYTREAGVRELERCIMKICRISAKKLVEGQCKSIKMTPELLEEFLGPRKYKEDETSHQNEIGVVNGLAWTSVGGEMMQVEVAVLDGSGKIELTGSLGDVMKESARTAVSYVRSRTDKFGIEHDFYKTKDIHIHVPEGAVPKDGPSAGVTIATAIVSALTDTPVRGDVAMTGEITLRGRVLPIGGLREKTMAAYTHHIRTIVIPQENESDLAEVLDVVKENVHFVTASAIDTVLSTALTSMPAPKTGEPSALHRLAQSMHEDPMPSSVPQ